MNIRLEVAKAIAARIGEAIPDLLTRSKASWDDEEEIATFPSLRVLPRSMELMPFQEDEIDDGDAPDLETVLFASVGEFEGACELRLFCSSKAQRNLLEDEVIALFLETEGAVGTLPVQTAPVVLKGRQTLYAAPVACSLDTAEWQEEMVFDKKRYSFMRVDVNFPALIARTDQYLIDSLRLAIAEDLAATVPTEVVEISEAGVLTPSS